MYEASSIVVPDGGRPLCPTVGISRAIEMLSTTLRG